MVGRRRSQRQARYYKTSFRVDVEAMSGRLSVSIDGTANMENSITKKLLLRAARESVIRRRGGLSLRSPDGGISFVPLARNNAGNLSIRQDGESHVLAHRTETGSVSVAVGSRDEMEALREAVWEHAIGDGPLAQMMGYGTVGLLLGIGISGMAMFISPHGTPEGADARRVVMSSPYVAPVAPSVAPSAYLSAPIAAPLPTSQGTAATPSSPAAPATTGTAASVPVPASAETFNDMVSRIASRDPVAATAILQTLQRMAENLRNNESIPQEMVNQLPREVWDKMMQDVRDQGLPIPVIRPLGSPNPTVRPGTTFDPSAAAAPSAAPVSGVAPAVNPATRPAVRPGDITDMSQLPSGPPASSRMPPPPSVAPLPLRPSAAVPAPVVTWGSDIRPGQLDANGIPDVPPRANWDAMSNAPVPLPGITGGTAETPEGLNSFGIRER